LALDSEKKKGISSNGFNAKEEACFFRFKYNSDAKLIEQQEMQ
jgi:hypothetical protein